MFGRRGRQVDRLLVGEHVTPHVGQFARFDVGVHITRCLRISVPQCPLGGGRSFLALVALTDATSRAVQREIVLQAVAGIAA